LFVFSAVVNEMVKLACSIVDGHVVVETEPVEEAEIVVAVAGTRAGREGVRFTEHTKEEAERNAKFWSQWR
jgi:hypothetical protein